MKNRPHLLLLTLLLLIIATPLTASAQTAGSSAKGIYQFTLGDRALKYAEFDAQTLSDGSATGSIYFSDEATIVTRDVDGSGVREEKIPGFFIRAAVDGLQVNKNQAVLSGTIREASHEALLGQRVLLTVEDNGDNTRVPDRMTWGIYRLVSRNWTPSDAELKEDPGVGLTWTATDAERRDDQGISMPRKESIDTQTFSISAYAFADARDTAGDILVQQ